MRTLTEICRDTFHAERQVAGTSAIDIQSLSQRNRKTKESAQQGHTLYVNARTGQFSEHCADF